VLTIVSWNVENLTHWLRDDKKRALRHLVEDVGVPDVLMLQEVKVRPQDVAVVDTMKRFLARYVCHVSLCSDNQNVSFRGGRAYGVATYVREDLVLERVWSPAWDREGRVVVVEIGDLAILNLYAVNGTSKRYWDHDLGRFEGDRHAFKRRVQALLIEEGKKLRARKKELVFGGDFNVTRTAFDTHPRLRTEGPHALARAHLNDVVIPSLDVVDVFRELHPDEAKYTWFRNSRTLDAARVDYFLVSKTLLPRVDSCGIEEELANQYGTDHAPIWLRLRA
jgi:exodeoxyribonuclease III